MFRRATGLLARPIMSSARARTRPFSTDLPATEDDDSDFSGLGDRLEQILKDIAPKTPRPSIPQPRPPTPPPSIPTKLTVNFDLPKASVFVSKETKLVAKMGKGKSNDGGDDVRQDWKEPNETGLGIDAGTGKLDAPDEWTRKIAACPNAGTFRKKGMPNLDSMDIMYGGTVATGKNAFCTSGQMPKESSEGSEDSVESEEFVDPQCQPSMNYVAMEIEDPSLSRAGLAIDKGKGKLNGVQIVRGIYKKQKKKRSSVQELSDSLKSNSDVFVESRTVSTRPPIVSTATTEFKGILDMVLSLPGVESGDRLYMFSTLFFMEKAENRSMFAALVHDKDIQLKWLEMQFRRNPQFHFP